MGAVSTLLLPETAAQPNNECSKISPKVLVAEFQNSFVLAVVLDHNLNGIFACISLKCNGRPEGYDISERGTELELTR